MESNGNNDNFNLISTLSDLANKLKSYEVIPNYPHVRTLLYSTFVIETGPACVIIKYHYLIEKLRKPHEYLHDPADQAHWLHQNWNGGKFIQHLRTIRNNIVHCSIFRSKMLIDLINKLIKYSSMKEKTNTWVQLAEEIVTICYCITNPAQIINEPKFTADPRDVDKKVSCPLCGNEVTSIVHHDKYTITLNEVEFNPVIDTLRNWKREYYNELKNTRIKILEGKHAGHVVTLICWQGTVATVIFDDGSRKVISLDKQVQISARIKKQQL